MTSSKNKLNFSKKLQKKIKKINFNNKGAVIDKGSIYVMVILTILIFGGYIMVGGTLPTKLPKLNTTLVNIVGITPEPSKASLQMQTFYGVTPTPYPTPIPAATGSPNDPRLVDCARAVTGTQENQMIWGYAYSSTASSDNENALKVFYTSQDAMLLGSGAVTQMINHPADIAANPSVGNEAARDNNNFPYFPSVYLTDITDRPSDVEGDAQEGGFANKPDIVYGAWKAQGAANPEANGQDLTAQADGWPPANGPGDGSHNTTFSAEAVFKISSLQAYDSAQGAWPTKTFVPVQAGRSYRAQIILHNGSDPTAVGIACVTLRL